MVLPTSLLLPANDVAVDALALTEMLAVGAHAARRTGPIERRRVLVVGAGPIGLATLAFLDARPDALWIYDLDPDRTPPWSERCGRRSMATSPRS
jgi:threonine dehydrogenase-like Zn-dependent dehydrogenase